MERKCDNCEFYAEERCVRFPPQVFFRRSDPGNSWEREYAAAFPSVPKPRWCGEFKPVSAPAAESAPCIDLAVEGGFALGAPVAGGE